MAQIMQNQIPTGFFPGGAGCAGMAPRREAKALPPIARLCSGQSQEDVVGCDEHPDPWPGQGPGSPRVAPVLLWVLAQGHPVPLEELC